LEVSKAFTRESDEAGGDEIVLPQTPFAPGTRRLITKAGADRLREQANNLLEEKRTLLNAGYAANSDSAAKVRKIEIALRAIHHALDSVVIAQPPADPLKIGFGASVQIRNQDGEEEFYQIVGPDEADPNQGRISSISPLARALINRQPGEVVRFNSPAGEQELIILAVRY
jgi:transcription elongation factor GreB